MRRVEVRCCCSPTKLLGTLPMPDDASSFLFVIMKPAPTRAPTARHYVRASKEPHYGRLELRLSEWWGPNAQSGVALKADGIPIETLRLIPGFIEAGTATGRIPDFVKKD